MKPAILSIVAFLLSLLRQHFAQGGKHDHPIVGQIIDTIGAVTGTPVPPA